jgi:heterodisulfide reductase subunit A2
MVVLSVGLKPTQETIDMANRLGIELNEYGFAENETFHPAETSRPRHLCRRRVWGTQGHP